MPDEDSMVGMTDEDSMKRSEGKERRRMSDRTNEGKAVRQSNPLR